MTIDTHGKIDTEIAITVEAIKKGTRTTVVQTDKIGELEPEVLGEEFSIEGTEYGIVKSSVVSRQSRTHDVRTTVCEKLDDEDDEEEWEIRVVSTASEEPIETHPAFSEENDNYPKVLAGTGDDRKHGAEFDGTEANSKFEYFPPNAEENLGGVTSYLVPSVVLEASKQFEKFDDVGWSQIYDVGKIKEPPIEINVGDRNWLLIGSQYTNDDGTWTVTNQYQLSGEKGWNPNIYIEKNANNNN